MYAMKKMILLIGLSIMSIGLQAQFKIIFDYRYDNGYFSNHPERKKVLEYVATLWEQVITTKAVLPAGSSFSMRYDYTKSGRREVVFNQALQGYVMMVYAHDFAKEVKADGSPDPSTSKAYGGCYGMGANFGYLAINTNASRPWFYDPTPATPYDVPINTHYDFITTATHEMGHALGFLLTDMQKHIITINGEDYFNGVNARRVNGGNPVPLEKNSSHIRGVFSNDNYLICPPIDRHVMHTHDPVQGYRQIMTAIDVAIMDDIGWDVDYTSIPIYPYTPKSDPRQQQLYRYGISQQTKNPIGLWEFNTPRYVDNAIIGYPMRYAPKSNETKGIKELVKPQQGCITIPRGGFLYCSHGIAPNGGGNDVNQYTLIMDVRISQIGEYKSLFNCNYKNNNDGEVFINKTGKWGKGKAYSNYAVPIHTWMRLAIVVNCTEGTVTFYKDGLYSHQKTGEGIDGSYAMYAKSSGKGLVALFSDNDGEDGEIDVKRVVMYDSPLTRTEINRVGNAHQQTFGL